MAVTRISDLAGYGEIVAPKPNDNATPVAELTDFEREHEPPSLIELLRNALSSDRTRR